MTIPRLALALALSVSAAGAQTAYSPADVQFVGGMIHHHAQAIVMSKWAPTHGASPAVLTLAERIINAQQDEIASMRALDLPVDERLHPRRHHRRVGAESRSAHRFEHRRVQRRRGGLESERAVPNEAL